MLQTHSDCFHMYGCWMRWFGSNISIRSHTLNHDTAKTKSIMMVFLSGHPFISLTLMQADAMWFAVMMIMMTFYDRVIASQLVLHVNCMRNWSFLLYEDHIARFATMKPTESDLTRWYLAYLGFCFRFDLFWMYKVDMIKVMIKRVKILVEVD